MRNTCFSYLEFSLLVRNTCLNYFGTYLQETHSFIFLLLLLLQLLGIKLLMRNTCLVSWNSVCLWELLGLVTHNSLFAADAFVYFPFTTLVCILGIILQWKSDKKTWFSYVEIKLLLRNTRTWPNYLGFLVCRMCICSWPFYYSRFTDFGFSNTWLVYLWFSLPARNTFLITWIPSSQHIHI